MDYVTKYQNRLLKDTQDNSEKHFWKKNQILVHKSSSWVIS